MTVDIEQYFKAILRWWWLILLSTIIAAGASYYASLQQPRIYQTTTTLLVGQVIQQANPTGSDFATVERLAESYAQIAVRQPVLQGTVDSLSLQTNWQSLKGQVYAYPIPRTQLLGITVEDTSPERAVAIADEVAYQLILQSPSSPDNKARQERNEFVQSEMDDLETKIQTAKARIQTLEAELETALSARQLQDLQTEITNLEALINDWQKTYNEFLTFLQGGNSPNYLTIIEPAQLPTVPVKPKVKINVLLATAAGFILALGAAILLEYIDDTIKSTDDLSKVLGVTVLGSINRIKGKDAKEKLLTAHSPFSPIAEAYRGLRTNIQFMAVDRPIRSILVTSTESGEGKSTTVVNMGITMAQAERKTIIVDADLRRPSLHQIFGLPNVAGLTDLLCSPDLEVESYLKTTNIENLQIITSGPLPPNPAEMLGSQRMANLLQHLEELAEVIIFDSPPVLPVSDAAILSSRIDGVVLVIRAKRTRRDIIQQAVKRLQHVNANLLGSVLNQTTEKGGDYYYHYSTYTNESRRGVSRNQFGQPLWRRWWQRLSEVF